MVEGKDEVDRVEFGSVKQRIIQVADRFPFSPNPQQFPQSPAAPKQKRTPIKQIGFETEQIAGSDP
jgi:hypothetical protein